MFRLLCLIIGYAFGCIQSAYIIGKLTRGIDIREHGSKNSGFTNANRVMGFKVGIWIFIADILKAVLAFLVAGWLFNGGNWFLHFDAGNWFLGMAGNDPRSLAFPVGRNGLIPGLWAGLGVVLGHNFPVFMKFRGGKGIASTIGILLMLDWRAAVIIYVIAALLVLLTRYISLASLVITLLMPVFMALFGHGWEVVAVTACLTALAWFMHRGNIHRLVKGTERRFSFKGKSGNPT